MAENFVTQPYEADKIGVEVRSDEHLVEAPRTIAYAEAVEDTNKDHLSGRLAPPCYAVVPAMRPMARAMRIVIPGGFPVHGEHDLVISRPIEPGMRLVSTAAVTGIWPKPAGLVSVIRVATTTHDGTPVNEQYWINLIARATIAGGQGEAPADHRMPADLKARAPDRTERYPLTPALGRRYAEASGDHSPYTFDLEDALSRGLPGIIVGGICTMSYASRALVDRCCAGRSDRLKRLALRFSGFLVLREGQSLAMPMWDERPGKVRFEMADAEGTRVVSNGMAEISA